MQWCLLAHAMPQVDAPFIDAEIDSSDPSGSALSILYGVLGVGLLYMVLNYGGVVGGWMTSTLDGVIGTNASGDNTGIRGQL